MRKDVKKSDPQTLAEQLEQMANYADGSGGMLGPLSASVEIAALRQAAALLRDPRQASWSGEKSKEIAAETPASPASAPEIPHVCAFNCACRFAEQQRQIEALEKDNPRNDQ